MQYRRLGRSGLKVSEISLGNWLTYGSAIEVEMGAKCVKQAYELGINFFDCAEIYGHVPGAGEEALAEALKEFSRSSYVLTTKTYWPVGPGPNDRGLSRKRIMDAIDGSLKRLKTDYVDIYYCHRFDPETPLEETLRALEDIVRQGKALYIGFSMWTAAQIAQAIGIQRQKGYDLFAVSQPVYNMLDRHIEAEIMPLCADAGIGQVVFSPLAQGVLSGKYTAGQQAPEGTRAADPKGGKMIARFLEPETLAKVDSLKPIAADLGISLPTLALAWILRRPEVSSAIIGASRPEQVVENVKAVGVKLSDDVLARIDEVLGA